MDQNQNVQALPRMPFWTAVKTCFRKYLDFKGRARRSEYWWFVLFQTIVCLVLFSIVTLLFNKSVDTLARSNVVFLALASVVSLFFAIPAYAAQTRRLHDSGHSGWWVVATVVLSVIYSVVDYLCNSSGNANSDLMFQFLGLLSVINMVIAVIVLVFTIQDSQVGENKYGPSPKYK